MGTIVVAGQRLTPAVLNHMYGLADTNAHTVTAATAADLSTVYTIPAADAAAGTAYRITCFGLGVWGSTQQQLNIIGQLGGNSFGTINVALGTFAASGNFRFKATALAICASSGSGGTLWGEIDLDITQTDNPATGLTAAANSQGMVASKTTATAFNTTISNVFSVQADWGSTTGAPTLTANGTLFERVN